MTQFQVFSTSIAPLYWADAWQILRLDSGLGLALSVIIGAVLGSLANVVIWRLPRRESIVRPGSHCPHCGDSIPLWRNIPILSYFFQAGNSACCGKPIPARYPVVEVLCAMVLGSLYVLEGWTATFAFTSAWMLLLIILAAIDWEHYRLPNVLVGIGLLISLLWMILSPHQSWLLALLGLLTGLGFAGVTMLIGKLLRGNWSGLGDLKLAMVLGFTFGPGKFVIVYLVTALMAALFGLFRAQFKGEKRVPMGPFFALGVWTVILAGDELVRWYLGFLY